MTPAVPPNEPNGTHERTLAVIATGWGPSCGGINAFNLDFCLALGRVLRGSARVVCITTPIDDITRADVAAQGVDILCLRTIDTDNPASTVEAASALLRSRSIYHLDLVIGHDVFTGEIATGLRSRLGGAAAVVHHMNYGAYQSQKKNGKTVLEMEQEQRRVLRSADRVLAVGPLLLESGRDLCQSTENVRMLIPGVADIAPATYRPDREFRGIAFGRLGGEDDRIKQGRLAAAGFGRFARSVLGPPVRRRPRFNVFGLSDANYAEEEAAVRALVTKEAGQQINIIATPYTEDRETLFRELVRNEVALMLSWHEGFGLVGWEALAAQVPLVISRATGLYRLLEGNPELPSLGCVKVVDVRGSATDTLNDQDVDAVANALMEIEASLPETLERGATLRNMLRAQFTWEGCARAALDAFGWGQTAPQACNGGGTNPGQVTPPVVPSPSVGGITTDIERLRQLTLATHRGQHHLSRIRLGSALVKIVRPSTAALIAAARTGSLLVVGDPGIGKSVAQSDLVQHLLDQHLDVVLLSVDQMTASNMEELRTDLGLQDNLLGVLRAWTGTEPGFVVIDALDAARSDASARTLRLLISQILADGGRWCVIASVRKFDLRYSQELQRLFAGPPHPDFHDPAFGTVRHVNTPPLADEELAQVGGQSPSLDELVRSAGVPLRDLLRVPFNLNLAAALLEGGATITELSPVRTQLELFDRYWLARVRREDRLGDAREAVMRIAAEEMVRLRALRAPRSIVAANPSASAPLHDLLSSHVLVEWQPPRAAKPDESLLAFPHHLLYDYGVARLLLRGEATHLVRRLEESPDLALAIRPSLVLHLQHVWYQDPQRELFWDLVARLMASELVPDIAKTIGPSVAADLMTAPADYSAVLGRLEVADER
jgi:glycosyltransferase involved in cell wall biosynthesis